MKSIFSMRCGQMGTGQQRSEGVRKFQIRFTGLKFVLVVDEPGRNCLPLSFDVVVKWVPVSRGQKVTGNFKFALRVSNSYYW